MSWKKAKLSECCQSISDGDHQAPPKSNKGIPFVTISNIKDNSFDFTNCMHVPQSYYDNLLAKRKPQKGDILYSVVGSFGIPVLMKENVKFTFQRHIAILRPNPHIVEPAYMYYSMLSKAFFLQADAAAIGAAQRTISLSSLQNLTINLPDLPTQRRIASILSAYDDLIENNRRQIKLLEEAAQRLYREWFVELRFPGHEGVKVVDGVPEGWMKVCLKDICETKTGKKDANFGCDDGAYPFFTCAQAPIKAPSYSFDCSAVILAGNGDFNVKLYRGKFEAYQRTYVLSPANTEYLFLLYNAVSRNMNVLTKGASGSTIKFLTKGMIDSIELLIPSSQLLTTYNQNSEALQKSIEALHRKVALAVEARDRLLPKLMNHEMEVML